MEKPEKIKKPRSPKKDLLFALILIVIAVVLLICIYLFGYERDKGLYSLIRCTKFGRLKTIISKLAVLFVLSAVV